MTLKVIHRLHAFPNAIRWTFVQHFTFYTISTDGVLARFLCISRASCCIGRPRYHWKFRRPTGRATGQLAGGTAGGWSDRLVDSWSVCALEGVLKRRVSRQTVAWNRHHLPLVFTVVVKFFWCYRHARWMCTHMLQAVQWIVPSPRVLSQTGQGWGTVSAV